MWIKSEPSLEPGQQIDLPNAMRRIPVRTIRAGRFILEAWFEFNKHNENGQECFISTVGCENSVPLDTL